MNTEDWTIRDLVVVVRPWNGPCQTLVSPDVFFGVDKEKRRFVIRKDKKGPRCRPEIEKIRSVAFKEVHRLRRKFLAAIAKIFRPEGAGDWSWPLQKNDMERTLDEYETAVNNIRSRER